MSIVIALIIDALVCSVLAANLAEKKGYSSGAWGACGFFFGILGLIAAAGLPIKADLYLRERELTKVCPSCAEVIKLEAQTCKYCGQTFNNEAVIAELSDTLFDKSFEIRQHASFALLSIGTITALSAVLERSDYPDKLSAISALTEIHDGPAITTLIHGLWNKSIRKKVSSALVKIGNPAIPFLEKAVNGEGGELIRKYAENIIKDIKMGK
jgi:RNA polymerase subunit RPABC4/transcription elongation factor Spt4